MSHGNFLQLIDLANLPLAKTLAKPSILGYTSANFVQTLLLSLTRHNPTIRLPLGKVVSVAVSYLCQS